MATKQDVAKIVTMLSAAYPNWQPNQYTAEIYFQDLQDIDTDLLMVGVKHCRTSTQRDQRFAPSAGEIRQAVSDIRRQSQGVPSAVEAWAELHHVPTDEKIRKVTEEYNEQGARIIEERAYEWSHPLVRKVAVMMGFPKFPDWNSESFERTAFIKAYESELQSYLKQDAQPAEVRGYIENNQIKQLTKGMTR